MSAKPTIECKPDGPYIVKDLEELRQSDGASVSVQPIMALCRCGGSANKPFCDGTHRKIGFSGARLSDGSTDRRDDYKGRRITIHDSRSICAHAGYCTDGLAAVFLMPDLGSHHAKYPNLEDLRTNEGLFFALERHFWYRNGRCKHCVTHEVSTFRWLHRSRGIRPRCAAHSLSFPRRHGCPLGTTHGSRITALM